MRNIYDSPKIEKIVVNMGIGKMREDQKYWDAAMLEMAAITGQKASVRRAAKAIAGFKVRAGDPVGLTVTLRGKRMKNFLLKLTKAALPRRGDFRGLARKSFDGKGNYSLGIAEHTIFPEIDPNRTDRTKSFEITIVTTAKTDEEGLVLLENLEIPLEKVKS